MKSLLLILTVLLPGCGTDQGKSSGGSSEEDGEESTSPANEKTDEGSVAKMLGSLSDLPDCTDDNQNQLAYVIAEESFYTCSKLDWKSVDIKGKDGKDGASGENIAGSEFWQDPETGKLWYKAGQAFGSYGANCLTDVSDGVFRYPTVSELQGALSHGLYDGYRLRMVVKADSKYIYSDNPDVVLDSVNGFQGFLVCIEAD